MDLQQALAAHWEAKHALDYWKKRESEAKLALADALCKDDDGYANKTLKLGDGTKLSLAIKRDIKVKTNSLSYVEFVKQSVEKGLCTKEQLDAFRRENVKVSFNLTGYRELPEKAKAVLADAASESETVSINYIPPTDDR